MDFDEACDNFFYDAYMKGREGHEWTDEEITLSAHRGDIDDCVEALRKALYKHFGIKD